MILTQAVRFKQLLNRNKYVNSDICKNRINTDVYCFYSQSFELSRILRELLCRLDEPRILEEMEILIDYFVHLQKCIYEITYISIRPFLREMQRHRDEYHERMTKVYQRYPLEEPSYEIIPCYRKNGIYYYTYIPGGFPEDYPEEDDPTDCDEEDDISDCSEEDDKSDCSEEDDKSDCSEADDCVEEDDKSDFIEEDDKKKVRTSFKYHPTYRRVCIRKLKKRYYMTTMFTKKKKLFYTPLIIELVNRFKERAPRLYLELLLENYFLQGLLLNTTVVCGIIFYKINKNKYKPLSNVISRK